MNATNDTNSSNGVSSEIGSRKRGWRFYAALGSICLVNLMTALDASVVSVALSASASTISDELHGTGIEAFWVGTSFLLSATVSQPAFVSLSNLFGRKALLLSALSFFTAGCAIAGWASKFPTLLGGRSVQGIGAGGITALSSVLLTDLFTLRERGKWAGLVNLIWAIGTVSGPSIGGALSQNGAWRWIFWINLPFCGVAFPVVIFFLTLEKVPGTILVKLHSFDWIGLLLFTCSATFFLLGITWGGVQFPWSSWQTLVPLVLGFIGLGLFIVYDIHVPANPLIRFRIFSNISSNSAFIGTIIHGIVLFALFYYSPLYAQAVHNFNPLKSGVGLIPNAMAVAPAAAVTGILIAKTGRYRWAVWVGWGLMTLGTGILLVFTARSSATEVIFLYLIVGLGAGLLFTSLMFAIQASARPEDSASCGFMFALLRLLGQTLGVAIGGVTFQNQIKSRLEQSPLLASQAGELARLASELVSIIKQTPDDAPEKAELIDAFQGAFHTFVYILCALSAAGLALSALTKGKDVNQQHVTDQRFKPSQHSSGSEVESSEGISGKM
ncbi:major facilitator superfamily domain-containing protein [Xylogone sp. PMI_703]|nr:major facilitator superfamily domain-containing protein [Xylogone sp. PMI_703]